MYLGIDLGTSGVKTLLIDDSQRIIATANAPLTVSRPQSGWSEQSPNDWIEASRQTFEALKASHGQQFRQVTGIGLSGQMHGATLIDSDDQPVRPCLLWNDTRSADIARELDTDSARAISGNIVFPGFTAPKTLWVKTHEPKHFETVRKVLLPKDFLRLWLTGDYCSEMSDAAGTAWLDVGKRCWSDQLLNASGLDRSYMPALVEGTASSGQLRESLRTEFGFGQAVAVAGGAGDNAASAIGMGTINEGSAFLSLGTSGVLFAANSQYLPNPASAVHTFCHALPNTWHQMGVILSATDSLNWLAKLTGQSASDLTDSLGDVEAPTDSFFLPYLGGERTPHNDAAARGMLTGLDHNSGPQELTKVVLAGVSFAFRDNLAALEQAGTSLTRVTAIGGGSNSDYWLSLLATVLNLPVETTVSGDFGAGFGAARLGLIAANNASPDEICIAPKVERVFEPDASLTGVWHDAWQHYQSLYSTQKLS